MNEPNEALLRLAPFLKGFRLERDWSEAALARRAGLSEKVVRDYESDPSQLTLEVAAQVLSILSPTQIVEAHVNRSRDSDPSQPPTWLLNQMESEMLEIEAAFGIDEKRFPKALKAIE